MAFSIGTINIKDPVFLAPMSGISDWPFRQIVKRFGAGLVFSEMIASRAMLQERTSSLRTSSNYAEEYPMAVQLAGYEPHIMAEAARINVDRGAAIIDINFGCPVKKIVKKFAGSALMQNEALALQIMEATVRAVNVPVTVKMRLGWDDEHLNAPQLAKMAEDVGVRMITVHGRTRAQMFNGTSDWTAIRAVKDAVNLPIIINGDILSPQDARQALDVSGADGVMIGRGCCGKPWLLQQTIDYLCTGQVSPPPSFDSLYKLIKDHYESMLNYYGIKKGVAIARKHLSWYCSGMPNSAAFRSQLNKINDPETVKFMLKDYFAEYQDPVHTAMA